MLLIHSATLEIRSVLRWLRSECYYKNSICMVQVPGTLVPFHTLHVGKYTARISALSCCMPVSVGNPNDNDLLKLQRNDQAMIRWTCNVRLKDHISSGSLLRKLGINNIQTLLRYNRLRWFGHVVRNDGCINSITEFEVVGQRGRGRQKKTWKDTINNDLRHWKLSRADPTNRMEWRKKLRTNIGAVRPTLSGTDTLNE